MSTELSSSGSPSTAWGCHGAASSSNEWSESVQLIRPVPVAVSFGTHAWRSCWSLWSAVQLSRLPDLAVLSLRHAQARTAAAVCQAMRECVVVVRPRLQITLARCWWLGHGVCSSNTLLVGYFTRSNGYCGLSTYDSLSTLRCQQSIQWAAVVQPGCGGGGVGFTVAWVMLMDVW